MVQEEVRWSGWAVLLHSARTTVAVLAAGLFRLPETYWAAITTLVITQSSLGAAPAVSWAPFRRNGARGVGCDRSGLLWNIHTGICHLPDRSAYRFGRITLTIVLLLVPQGPAWRIAFHRFAEVSIAIGVALVLAVIWPETFGEGANACAGM